jgi:hypothetical protein
MAMPRTGIPFRIFLTCWMVYCLHYATDFMREHFLVASIVERHTFTLDPYAGRHADLFQHTNGHTYHGANPGISMLGAIPYFVLHPVVEKVVQGELARRSARGDTSAVYNDPRPARQAFYAWARAAGYDVRFGLIGLITMVFCMAPIAAGGAVVMYRTLHGAGLAPRLAVGGTLLYAFGTPMFFRSAYLNQNLAVTVFIFSAFAVLWNPGDWTGLPARRRELVAGLLGGMAFLCDYTGAVLLAGVGLYALVRAWPEGGLRGMVMAGGRITLGALGPILVLWWYQWACFGHPFLPPQNWMPRTQALSTTGWKGITGPELDLLVMLLFDPRFGLLVTGPVLALAVLAPLLRRRSTLVLPTRELAALLLFPLLVLLFFSSVQYTRLQYIHGIRYVIPAVPFLLVATVVVLLALPRWIALTTGVFSITLGWGLAMGRLEEQHRSILEGLKAVYLGGLRLPALTTLGRMAQQYLPELGGTPSPIPLFLVTGALLWLVWKVEDPWRRLGDGGTEG